MRRDNRPYFIKRLDLKLQQCYANHFLRPQFENLGRGGMFLGPWYVELFGGPINLGDYANVIATQDKRVRLTVWSNFEGNGRIDIGKYALICPGVRIGSALSITIGDSCMMAQDVQINDSDWHDLYNRGMSLGHAEAVVLKDNVWLGNNVIVCKGVTIGENSVVGAGAVVVKDIPPNVVAAGNPAVVVKELEPGRSIQTRANLFSKPDKLISEFDEIDRAMLGGNTFFGWLRSLFFPKKGD